jgi:hypothetical protein
VAVREGWGGAGGEATHLLFAVGEAACPLPTIWRLHNDQCSDWQLKVTSTIQHPLPPPPQVPRWLDDNVPFLLPEEDRSPQKTPGSTYPGFTFTVRSFPVMVESLGINLPLLASLARRANSSAIEVELKDAGSGQIIYQASFNKSDLDATKKKDGYLYKPIQNRRMPLVSFQGLLLLRLPPGVGHNSLPRTCAVTLGRDFGDVGLVQPTGLLQSPTAPSIPITKNACPLVSLTYSVLDPDTIKRLHRSKSQQIEMERLKNKDLRSKANLEEEEYGDMLFLPVIDSIETNCEKIKHFSKHAIENLEFDNLLLVDDKTYVFVDNILAHLKVQSSPSLWWANFQTIPATKASLLPPLLVPRTQAMLLSRDLVQYISQNVRYLKSFDSILAAFSVWFAGLETKTVNDQHWSQGLPENLSTFKADENMLAIEGVSPHLMRQLWRHTRSPSYSASSLHMS